MRSSFSEMGERRWRARPHSRRPKALISSVLAALTACASFFVVQATAVQASGDPSNQVAVDSIAITDSDQRHVVDLTSLSRDVFGGVAVEHDGSGIDVAIIDTGVADVDGLRGDKVLHGPDLSIEGAGDLATVDTYGHGTHLASIIAGDRAGHEGVAPGARLVSLKVAGADGEVSIDSLIAAIEWVIHHKDSDGLDIRVLNFSFGVADLDTHVGDPVAAALERAWDAGIVVVAAAGNHGDSTGHLMAPAIDPYVIAVGAVDSRHTDDGVEQEPTAWTARGSDARTPDVAAPGRSIAGYRAPGSTIDAATPSARYGDDLFLGSGTSQSAAVVSGLVARMLDRFPALTPDQVKATLTYNADAPADADEAAVGSGVVNGADSISRPLATSAPQNHARATGDAAGASGTWQGGTWAGGTWAGGTWAGGTWAGGTWAGGTWAGGTWAGGTWAGGTWAGGTWAGGTWAGGTWAGGTWAGGTWAGGTWA